MENYYYSLAPALMLLATSRQEGIEVQGEREYWSRITKYNESTEIESTTRERIDCVHFYLMA